MKLKFTTIIVILAVVLQLSTSKNRKKVRKSMKTHYKKHRTSLRHRQSNINNSINSLGHWKPGHQNAITEFPMTITSCDQTAFFEGQRIVDMKDYSKRETAYFSVNAYYMFQFKTKDVSTLQSSQLIHDIKVYPQIIPGSLTCITVGKINACLDTESKAKNILDVIHQFSLCRIGNDLSTESVLNMVRQCVTRKSGLIQSEPLRSLADYGVNRESSSKINFKGFGHKVPGTKRRRQ